MEFLKQLTPQAREGTLGLYHASPRDPVWEYVLSTLLAELCMDVQDQRVCLIGHSHVALSFVRRDGDPATGEPRRDGDSVDLGAGEWLLNPGSVGQPRDGDPRAAYAVIDDNRVELKRQEYPVDVTLQTIQESTLPDQAKAMLNEVLRTGRGIQRNNGNNKGP